MSMVTQPISVYGGIPAVDPRFGPRFAAFVTLADSIIRAYAYDEVLLCELLTIRIPELLLDASWIPESLTLPTEEHYRRECLYQAEDGAFSVGVFTWMPGHRSRIHDHHSWAVLGNVSGILRSENFLSMHPGRAFKHAPDHLLEPGQALWSTRTTGDIHRVSVASQQKSTSIHIYGCRFDAVNRAYYDEQCSEET